MVEEGSGGLPPSAFPRPTIPTTVARHAPTLAAIVAEAIADWIRTHPGRLVCLAAGDTPLPVYDRLQALQAAGRVDLSSVFYVGLDEWVGLGSEDQGSCMRVMHDAYYGPAGIPEERRRVFDGLADPEAECRAVERWIADHGGIGLTLLGIGLNGHVGFNEPGAPDRDGCLVVDLDGTTKDVSVKYFGAARPVRQGVTVGTRALMEAERILLMASGTAKAPIVDRLRAGADPAEVPAARLLGHPGLHLYLDRDAADQD